MSLLFAAAAKPAQSVQNSIVVKADVRPKQLAVLPHYFAYDRNNNGDGNRDLAYLADVGRPTGFCSKPTPASS